MASTRRAASQATKQAASQAAATTVTTSRTSKVPAKPFKEVARMKDGERPGASTTATGPSQPGGAVPHSQADKRHASKCAVCDAKIVDGKDEAVFCEGLCQQWIHRYCAGVSKVHFERLAASAETKYECAACFCESQTKRARLLEDAVALLQVEFTELHNAIGSLQKLQSLEETLKILSLEVDRLRESCEGLSHSCSHRDLPGRTKTFHHQKSVNHFEQQSSESGPMLPQGGNGGRGGRGRGGNMAGGKGRGRGRGSAGGRGSGLGQADVAMKPGGNGDSDRQSVNNARRWEEKKKSKRVRISGARKIWGTLRATTAVAVKNAIFSITKIPTEEFVVKRKYKSSPYTTKWWFVIRGEESMLKKLEAVWPSMFLQTTWKLEDVFIYSELSLQSGESQTPPANLSTPCVPLPSNNSIPGHSEDSNAVSQCSGGDNATMSLQHVDEIISLDVTPQPHNIISQCSTNDNATVSPQLTAEPVLQPPSYSSASLEEPTIPSSGSVSQSSTSAIVSPATDSFLDVLTGPLVQLTQ